MSKQQTQPTTPPKPTVDKAALDEATKKKLNGKIIRK
jgi:hypothetical protein